MTTARQVQSWFESAKDDTGEWRSEAKDLYDLVACRQWTAAEESEIKEKRRIPIVMNRIAPFVDSIVGQQINNRKEVRFLPRETSDTQLADMYTEASRWADDLCDGEDEVTDAFTDLVISGMGWTETRMDYSTDPEGKLITASRIDPIEMYWPTSDTSRNLDNGKWVIRARKYPADEAEDRWPNIKNVAGEWTADDIDMRQPHDATNAWKYESDKSSYFPHEQMYLVLQVQYYKDVPMYRVADPDSGQILTVSPDRLSKMRDYLEEMGVKFVKITQRRYFQAFVCGSELLEDEIAATQKGFTLKCMTGKRDRNKRQWYGVCRALRDPQKFSNKFFSDIMFILATNRKGGAFVEADALADPRRAEEDWASPDALIKLNAGGLNKVRERDAGVFPAGLERLMQYAIDAVPATSGVNAEMIGMADRNQPAILEESRKVSGLTILAPLFDSLKRHQRERGRIVLDFLNRFIADGRAIRIASPTGDRISVPFMQDPQADTYDIIVDEMPSTPNSKAETFNVLTKLMPIMQSMGMSPPSDLINYMPLPATLVEKWRGELAQRTEQPDPQQQMLQAATEFEMMKQQANQQEVQMKSQLEMLKLEFEKEKTAIATQTNQQDAALKQGQLQLEAQIKSKEAEIKAQEAQIKAAELELKRQELALKSQSMQIEATADMMDAQANLMEAEADMIEAGKPPDSETNITVNMT